MNENYRMDDMEDGFESDEELKNDLLDGRPEGWEDIMAINAINVRKKLDPAVELPKKPHSLEPDMIGGWSPKIPLPKPIPLTFNHFDFDSFLDYYLKNSKLEQKIKLCFLGARYESTYYAWYDRQFQFPYKHMNSPKNLKITDRFFCGQHWQAESQEYLIFDSLFESGNLDCAFKVGQNEYDLFMRVDSNTKGHLQWFNFKVSNFKADTVYKFNICNFQKGKILYNRGMRPYMRSMMEARIENRDWHQTQEEAKFVKKPSKVPKLIGCDAELSYYQLKFTFKPKYDKDQVQFAYCIPYTYSYLQSVLSTLKQKNSQLNFFLSKKLCSSLGGLEVPEITITDNVSEEQQAFKLKQKLKKRVIILTARCHPGETNGSWMAHGFIHDLCSNSQRAQFLRKNIIFKIFPMLNPDGVAIGNYRTGLLGKDFNRIFINPDKAVFPEVYHLKQLVWKYKQIYREDVSIYLDLHGHSVKKNVFAYGPQYPIIHKFYYQCKVMPKIFAAKSDMFRYYSCIFKISESKQSTARAVILRSFRIPFTYTIQASNGSYYDQENMESIDFDSSKWCLMGEKILEGIHEYYQIVFQFEKIKKDKLVERKRMLQKAREMRSKKLNKRMVNYTTSADFYRKENNWEYDEVSFSSMVQNKSFKNDQYKKMFSELKDENQEKKEIKSDDEISEGKSDSEGSADDLEEEEMQELINIIKNYPKKNKVQKQKSGKVKNKSTLRMKTMYNTSPSLLKQEQEQQEEQFKKPQAIKTRQIFVKKILKKKSTAGMTISPKKQESQPQKIVNFRFDMKPTIQTPLKSTKNINDERKILPDSEKSKRVLTTSYEYSDTFKKTFLSVQKQISKRDSHKRYIVLWGKQQVSAEKSKHLVSDIRGKKIEIKEQ